MSSRPIPVMQADTTWQPAQRDFNASVVSGNMALGSNNLSACPVGAAEYHDKVIISSWNLVGLCTGLMLLAYFLGAMLVCYVQRAWRGNGYMMVDEFQKGPVDDSQRPLMLEVHLGPEDDEVVSIGRLDLELYCTRRQLLQAYNRPSATLTVMEPPVQAYWPNAFAHKYMRGFELKSFGFEKILEV